MKFLTGKVRWFNSKLGYGFINCKNIEQDIYVHYTDINVDGYKCLFEDDIVEFMYDDEKNKALNVEVVNKKQNVKA